MARTSITRTNGGVIPRRLRLLAAALCACSNGPSVAAEANDLLDFSTLYPTTRLRPFSVSADGTVVTGSQILRAAGGGESTHAFRWTQAGLQTLPAISTNLSTRLIESSGSDVSADGSVVVGTSRESDGPFGKSLARAFRWTAATGTVSLGLLNNGSESFAGAANSDGTVVTGFARDGAAGDASRAFRWTLVTGLVGIGVMRGGTYSVGAELNADGTVIVGWGDNGTPGSDRHAFRWSRATGMVSLGTLNGGRNSTGVAVSADGAVVVGWSSDGSVEHLERAFRWTQATGMESLGVLPGAFRSGASGISADGKVIVGDSDSRAFRWTRATGMQSVDDWLRANGVKVTGDIAQNAHATNSDGSVVVGETRGNRAGYIARVTSPLAPTPPAPDASSSPEPAPPAPATPSSTPSRPPTGNGLITLPDVQESLAVTASSGTMVLSAFGTLFNGAHTRPLARRVPAGRNTFWAAGDWGRDTHGDRDGRIGLAELGLGRNFGPAQVNVGLGEIWARQDFALNGRAKVDHTYVLAEALVPVAHTFTATLGVYAARGETDLRRGYVNAGSLDTSTGSPDMKSAGLRLRFDWENAVSALGAQVSPYVDFTHARTKLDGYTEADGGFPARFDARKDKATEVRLGTNAVWPLTHAMRFVGTLEGAHRFEDSSVRTTGNLVGLFSFDLPGIAYDRTWMRGGLGLEGKLARGTASVMLNATTKGQAPAYWVTAGWQLVF